MSLRKELGLFSLTMIAIGSTIGSGIFLTPGKVAEQLPDPMWFLIAWALGGLVALLGSMSYAELGGMYPQAGGLYNYLRAAYGRPVAFLYGWANLMVVNTGSLAALSLAVAQYASRLAGWPDSVRVPLAMGVLALLTLYNITGVKRSGWMADISTVLKLLGIACIVGIGFGMGELNLTGSAAQTVDSSGGLPWAALGLAMSGVFWSYGGWQHASYLAGEARRPEWTVPRAMVLGALGVTVAYITINLAYLALMTPAEIANSKTLAPDAMDKWLGPWAGTAVTVVVLLSIFGTLSIYTMSAPRIYFRMAEDKSFFPALAKLHPKYDTPATAMLIQSAWALVLIVAWKDFGDTIEYVLITDWLFFGLAALAVPILRLRQPQLARPVRTLLYPLPPLLFAVIAFAFVAFAYVSNYWQAVATTVVMGAGLPVYLYFRRRQGPGS